MNYKMCIAAGAIAAMSHVPGDAGNIAVREMRYAGPFAIPAPVFFDERDVNNKPYSQQSPLEAYINLDAALQGAGKINAGELPEAGNTPAIGVLGFRFSNSSFITPELKIDGLTDYKVFVDGVAAGKEPLRLNPGTHNVAIKYLSLPGRKDSVRVTIIGDNESVINLNPEYRLYTLNDVLHGPRILSTAVSPDGRYLLTAYRTGLPGGKSKTEWRVTTISGAPVATSAEEIKWMPRGSRYYSVSKGNKGREMRLTDASTLRTTIFASGLPEYEFFVSPDEKSLIVTRTTEGPKEDADVYRILEPEDRQPGWRTRSSVEIYDIATGVSRPLTFGSQNVVAADISDDSSKLLLKYWRSRLARRPTTMFTLALLDLNTMKLDTLVTDGFIRDAKLTPDARGVLICAGPEAFGGIGKNVPEGRIPSMEDMQLYMCDVATKSLKPLTREFDPAIADFAFSRADGALYFTAFNRDKISLYRYNPKDGKITGMPVPQDLVNGFSVPSKGQTLAMVTQSMDNPDRLYTLNVRSGKAEMLDEPLREQLSDARLGDVKAWDFVNSQGDNICGRFYLPPNFDPAKKYPLIVDYYGGCSPVSRNFESRYPHHAYAAQDYVVYVIEPSGAVGFGQEFSSRHVNTAGEGVARDIIEGTREFCKQHPYVDSSKIGCIGASYGGFMTQYLLTETDMFAAAISHAGISDHTSYWGEGYWGYSYSEVSMAGSYPWSDPDLYTKQSPLFRVDKIHTPLLLLHGDADHNVPVGESIQMFTALKLLGRPTAFIAVKDQDHHIMQYDKRIKWQDTIFAWFAKYLKDDNKWWEALYPETSL